MEKLGYIRKVADRTLSHKVNQLISSGCSQVMMEESYTSGAIINKEFYHMLENLSQGDEIVICELAELGLESDKLLALVDELEQKGIVLTILGMTEPLTNMDEKVKQILRNFVEMDAELFYEQTKISGHKMGKYNRKRAGRPSLSDQLVHEINRLHESGLYTYREIATLCDVSLGTVSKYIKDSELDESK